MAAVLGLGFDAVPVPAGETENIPFETSVSEGSFSVGVNGLTGEFSPFFSRSGSDQEAAALTQENLLVIDRSGGVICKGIEGETVSFGDSDYTYYGPADCTVTENDDGSAEYEIHIRDDLEFSDGVPVTIDDVIFSLYVRCDPTYDGLSGLAGMPIEGLEEYRSGMHTLFSLISSAGEANTDFTYWTEEEQKAFFNDYDQAVLAFTQEIVDYCKASGYNGPDDSVAACAASWGYKLEDGADLKAFWDTMVSAYNGDIAALTAAESAGSSLKELMQDYDSWLKGVETGTGADSISGIEKVDDHTLRIRTTQMNDVMLSQLAGAVCPMHYYGDPSLYDYENNSFGFVKGDLSLIRERNRSPLGMGPYTFVSFEDGTVLYEKNTSYYKGEPKVGEITLVDVQAGSSLDSIADGTVDAAVIDYDDQTAEKIIGINVGAADEDDLAVHIQDHPGFGYIGINADHVKVGDDASSDESRNLRRAFATLFAAYREEAVHNYYGENAQVIEYPISATSWAAPKSTEDGYEEAFSVGADGNAIYSDGMTPEERYAAAADAALGYFEAAGCTVENGQVTDVPEGVKTSYNILIPADGVGDHPAYEILTGAKSALEQMGITLEIRDVRNVSDIWSGLRSGNVEMWCGAWSAQADPDLYPVYYSGASRNGENAGASSYMYGIRDLVLDEMILMAREGDSRVYRKALYKACLDTIMEWACVVPTYQRKDAVVVRTGSVEIETLPTDMTAFYCWDAQLQDLELQ